MGKKRFKKDKYLRGGGVRCPYCGSYDITATYPPLTEPDSLEQEVECDYCGSSWKDVFKLTNTEEILNNT